MIFEEFHKRYIQGFSEQQLQAVRAVTGPVLLLAVPGSGKTTVLVNRLGYLVLCENIPPENILTMTYTVAATREMKQRFGRIFGEDLAARMEFRTINGLSARVIEHYSRSQGRTWPFALLENEGDASRLVGQIYQDVAGDFATESIIKDIRTSLTYIKNQMLTEDEIADQDFAIKEMPEIYQLYRRTLREKRLMDYDDQMTYALTILKKHPWVLEFFQDQYPYICVDEAQDTSRIQHEIIRILAQKHENLFLVGDEDQSIYGFRAACPSALLDFEKVHPGARILLMEQNYRSTPQIIGAANAFVRRNAQRYDKSIRSTRPEGAPVRVVECVDRAAQYRFLFALAQNCTQETAVLYRNNDSCLPLVDLLERSGVPYRCRNFDSSFFSHRIIQDITAFICLAQDPQDSDAFMRIYYKMDCCISKRAACNACDRSRASGKPILEELAGSGELNTSLRSEVHDRAFQLSRIADLNAEQTLTLIWDELRYGCYAVANGLDTGKFTILRLLAQNEPNAPALLERLGQLRELLRTRTNDPNTKFVLSTIHSSKGLEYDRVYLLDVLDGILPAKNKQELREPDDALLYEEDRRLFYVGMTRAKNELYLFRCAGLSSEFLDEVRSTLPRPVWEDTDLFRPLFENSCGRSYTHREYGRGRILACEQDRQLIEYESGRICLCTLSEMLDERAPITRYELPGTASKKAPSKNAASAPAAAVKKGSTVYHAVFGKGTVTSLSGDIASIQFEGSPTERKLSLSVCLAKGILELRAPV